MPTKSYYSVGGRIIGERTEGQPRVDYLTGPVGSVTATVDDQGQVVNRYRYKPYGQLLAKTGAGADPRFLWAGSFGYRQSASKFSDFYVRARHYSSSVAHFTTLAPTVMRWSFEEAPYAYGNCNPVLYVDPFGELPASALPLPFEPEPCAPRCCCCVDGLKFDNIREIPYTPRRRVMGHTFDVIASIFYKTVGQGESEGKCTLEWFEKTDRPTIEGIPPDRWRDIYRHLVERGKLSLSPTLREWKRRTDDVSPCPGRPAKILLPEGPQMETNYLESSSRYLCFRIVIKSSLNCNCANREIVITARQFLSITKSEKTTYSFDIPYTKRPCVYP